MSSLEYVVDQQPLSFRDIRPGYGVARFFYRLYKDKVGNPDPDDIDGGLEILKMAALGFADTASILAVSSFAGYLFS